eukprot:4428433-Pleurochrysis_carterae.AAC.5
MHKSYVPGEINIDSRQDHLTVRAARRQISSARPTERGKAVCNAEISRLLARESNNHSTWECRLSSIGGWCDGFVNFFPAQLDWNVFVLYFDTGRSVVRAAPKICTKRCVKMRAAPAEPAY